MRDGQKRTSRPFEPLKLELWRFFGAWELGCLELPPRAGAPHARPAPAFLPATTDHGPFNCQRTVRARNRAQTLGRPHGRPHSRPHLSTNRPLPSRNNYTMYCFYIQLGPRRQDCAFPRATRRASAIARSKALYATPPGRSGHRPPTVGLSRDYRTVEFILGLRAL